MKRIRLAPSILTADFGHLAAEVQKVSSVVDWFHLDVMDGHYVPNLTFGPATVAAVRRSSDRPIHVHLMIEKPARYAEAFVKAGASRISFHPEVVSDTKEVVDLIRGLGCGVGIALHPDVGLDEAARHIGDLDVVLVMTVRPGFGGQTFLDEVVPKITAAREMVEKEGADAEIEIDGGVNLSTVDRAVAAGGEILVVGSAVFDGVDPAAAARRMRERVDLMTPGEAG